MKTKEIILSQLLDEVYEEFPNESYSDWDIAQHVYDSVHPQWIKIESEADLPKELTRVLVHSIPIGTILAYHHKSIWRVPLEVREGERSNPDDDEYICSTKSKSITHYTALPQKPKED